MPRPIHLTIDSSALSDNLKAISDRLRHDGGGRRPHIWAVIKAHAYGHGLQAAVKGFSAADGLAMLDLDEAVRCRELGWSGPILLLEGFFEPGDLQVIDNYRLSVCVHNEEQLKILSTSSVGHPVDTFLKLNTGMHRLGFQPHEFHDMYRRAQELQAAGKLGKLGKMTHFARADDDPAFTREQIGCFDSVAGKLPGPVSLCNSAATLTPGLAAGIVADEHWVRPGVCLYGASPFAGQPASQYGLRAAMTMHAQIINIHVLPAGEGVGYGHAFRATNDMRIGIVSCGYADGYPRHAVNGTPVSVAGVRTSLVGRVSMDMLAVDLGPVPGATVGAPVVLWGEGGPAVDEVAASCGTIGYELLTAPTMRVPRRYI